MFSSFLFISRLVTLDSRAAADRCQSLRGARERADPHHFSVFWAGTLKIWGKYYITKIIVLFLGLSYFSRCIIYCRARYDDWYTPPVWDGLRPRCRLRGIASFYLMPRSLRQNLMLVSLYRSDETVASDVTLSLSPLPCSGDEGRRRARVPHIALWNMKSARHTEYRQRQRLFSCCWHDLRRIRIASKIPRPSMHFCSDARGLSVIFWRFDGLSSMKSPWGLHYSELHSLIYGD